MSQLLVLCFYWISVCTNVCLCAFMCLLWFSFDLFPLFVLSYSTIFFFRCLFFEWERKKFGFEWEKMGGGKDIRGAGGENM